MTGATRRSVPAATLLIAAILTWIGVRAGELFAIEASLSVTDLGALVAAAAIAWIVVARPAVGLGLLVTLVWLDLSEVLVRHHDAPSVLQLLAAPLALAAWVTWSGPLERHPLARPLTVLLAGWIVLLLASTTWAADTALADERVAETTKAFVVYALVASLATTRSRAFVAAWTLVASGVVLAGLGIFQATTGRYDLEFGGLARVKEAQIWGDVFEGRIAGPLGDPNYFAQILLVLVPVALFLGRNAGSKAGRAAGFGAAGLLSAAVVLTYSRGGALALAVVVGLSLLAMRIDPARLAAGVLVLLLGAALAVPQDFGRRLGTIAQVLPGGTVEEVLHPDSSIEKRKLVTAVAWHEFLERPALGVGAGNYSVHFDRIASQVGSAAREYEETAVRQYPHDLYLEVAAETGAAGLAVFGAALAVALAAALRARRRFDRAGDRAAADLSVAVAVAIAGYLVSSVFLHGDFQRYLWLLLGLAAALESIAPERPGSGRRIATVNA